MTGRAHPDMQIAQLLLGHRRRRIDQQVLAALRLGEGDHVADLLDAGHQRHQAVEAEGDPAMRRRALSECVEQETELPALILG